MWKRSLKRAPEEHLYPLIPGTQLGEWRVEAWQGQGAYGAVYRAVRVGQEHAGPVALKLALHPWDARLTREMELLSRLSYPGIPRLLGSGLLRLALDAEHPWFVMEWVEGMPLYSWAQQHNPSYRQVCQLLAQLARTLEAIHAAGAVHRDVKGANVLVRLSDRSPVLIDFGSGHFQGAQRLTWRSLPPGTPAYFSARACLFHILSVRERDSYYPPSPADDLYALGVTAFRLVMGRYPPDLDARQDESGAWHVASPDPRPLLESNIWVHPPLRECILRLLSDVPEERGTAAQLAEALEAAAEEREAPAPAAQPAPQPVPQAVPVPTRAAPPPAQPKPVAPVRNRRPWLVLAAAGVCAVLLCTVQPHGPVSPEYVTLGTQQASDSQAPEVGTAAVGDTSSTQPEASAQPSSKKKPVTQEPSAKRLPPQALPDKKGRCPGRKQVLINGSCWAEISAMSAEECAENGYVLLKGKCFAPALAPPGKAVPTSKPTEEP